jgi:aldehyde dehydrogenase (NAD+)
VTAGIGAPTHRRTGAPAHDALAAVFERQRARAPVMARTTAAERRERLQRLADAIESRRGALNDAVSADFRRPAFETEIAETQHVLSEIAHARRHLASWMKDERVGTSLLLFGTSGRIRYEARGVALIMAPWNYPFALLLSPLVAAIAAGNCAVLKPSEKTPHVSALMASMIAETFDAAEVACVEGDASVATALLELPFDHICFTGSTQVGKMVMAAAAKHLASVTLELGGKSPAIVGRTIDVAEAADRIVWGKFFNAGQTCIAPDYVMVHASREKAFVEAARKSVERFFGPNETEREKSDDLARIVDDGHFERLRRMVEGSIAAGAKAETGARFDAASRYVAPTVLSGVTAAMPVMAEEIFGPVLPVLTFESVDDCVRQIRGGGKPLAMYIFASSETAEELLACTSAGATVIGNTLLHYASHSLPFGGVGTSGIGSYHGVHGFRAFSHARAVMRQREPTLARFFFPPYRGRLHELARRLLRRLG